MTDTAEQAPAEPKPAKTPKAPKPCFCQTYELIDPKDPETAFNTGCSSTTLSMFGQGHDARLTSFLVDGYFDGYAIRQIKDGVAKTYATPADAAGLASDALRDKAAIATTNRQAKIEAKTARDKARDAVKTANAAEKAKAAEAKAAAKAAAAEAKAASGTGPKSVGAEVVAGSVTGDRTPLAEGQVTIKVGRWEYPATVNEETGEATYVDGAGAEQTVERDGYRVLVAVDGE